MPDANGAQPGLGALVGWVLLGLAAAAAFWALSADGLHVGQRDPIEYLAAAESLAAGKGLSLPFGEAGKPLDMSRDRFPLRHYPPAYPVLLSIGPFVGHRALDFALILHALLLGINGVLAALVAYRLCPSRAVATAALLVVVTTSYRYHAIVASEPVFVTVLLLYISALHDSLERGSRLGIGAATLLAGIAPLLRYMGVVFVAVGVVGIAVLSSDAWRHRAKVCMAFVALSATPLVAWTVFATATRATSAAREVAFHPPGLVQLKVLANTVSLWLLPEPLPPRVRVAGLVLGSCLLGWLALRDDERASGDVLAAALRRNPTGTLLGAMSVLYVILLGLAMSLFDAQAQFNTRLMYPSYLTAMLCLASFLAPRAAPAQPGGRVRRAASVLLLLVTSAAVTQGVSDATTHSFGPVNFNSERWRESPLVEIAANAPQETALFSNAPDGLFFLTGRSSWSIPALYDVWSRLPNHDLDDELGAMNAAMSATGGVTLVFEEVDRPYLVGEQALRLELGLQSLLRRPDGVALGSSAR